MTAITLLRKNVDRDDDNDKNYPPAASMVLTDADSNDDDDNCYDYAPAASMENDSDDDDSGYDYAALTDP